MLYLSEEYKCVCWMYGKSGAILNRKGGTERVPECVPLDLTKFDFIPM